MADKIAVMSNGLIEQFGSPQEIDDRPASMFAADSIGSPPMNFLSFKSGLAKGAREIVVQGAGVAVPETREESRPAKWCSAFAGAHPLRRPLRAAWSVYGTDISARRRSSRSRPRTA